MNTIITTKPASQPIQAGDFYTDPIGKIYVLHNYMQWIAVCLNDGNRWNCGSPFPERATSGLTRLPANTEIKLIVNQ